MKGGEVEKITRKLLPDFPGFAVRRADFFKVPLNGFFVGIGFEASNWDKNSFYMDMLCQPLFKLQPYFGSFHMFRLRSVETNSTCWEWDAPDILNSIKQVLERELLPFAERMADPLEFIKYAEKYMENNPHSVLRDIGLTWAWLGENKKSIEIFDKLIALPVGEYGSKWQNELKDEARLMVNLLQKNDDSVFEQLTSWENETILALKLEKFTTNLI